MFYGILTNPINRSIGLEFFTNAQESTFVRTSFVRGKVINYNGKKINILLQLRLPIFYGAHRGINVYSTPDQEEWERILQEIS